MPSVSVYTRHNPSCPKRDDPRWKRCRCPKWHYCPEWNPSRRTAKTRSWEEAERKARLLEAPELGGSHLGKTVTQATTLYLEDKEQQSLSENWGYKLKREMKNIREFCAHKPIIYMREWTLAALEDYRKTWAGEAITRRKRQERLRGFFSYCHRHGWIDKNVASLLTTIKVPKRPTEYFTQEQFSAILKACDEYNPDGIDAEWRRKRARAMVLLLRWSGLRLGDAARLERSRIQDGKLFLYTQKTGTAVWLPLPANVVSCLESLENPDSPAHFFWSGSGKINTPVYRWWETLKAIFRRAGMPDAHPHQFRHTFSVELLLSGVPIEQVSIALGHSSIKITERHYAPFCKARQDQLENSVRKSWSAHA